MSTHLLLLETLCPHCGARLTDGSRVRLDAYIRDTGADGVVSLSAIFGDYSVDTDLAIPNGAIAEFRCPQCDESLMVETPCRVCGAPMASLNLQAGGVIEFCSRRGCRGHALGGFGDVDQMMSLVSAMLNAPHDW